jgi:hypothetical protein
VGPVACELVADETGEVAERLQVRNTWQEHASAVAVDNRFRLASIARSRLREVVEDRDELDVVTRRRGGDLGEVWERRNVPEFIET